MAESEAVHSEAAPAPVDEENAAEGDSMDESIDEGESLLKTEAPPEAGPGSPAPSDSVLSEAAKQKFNELIYWSNPKLTALTFLGLNGIFIVLVVVRATLLSIVSTSLMYAIAISFVYHSAAFAYGRFTGQALVLQPYVKQLGQRALSPDFDVDFGYVEDAMAAAPAVTFQTTINKLAGALEGGLNELLVAIWQAIMLKKPFLTAKVFLGAYLLSWLGARLDAFQILWTAVVALHAAQAVVAALARARREARRRPRPRAPRLPRGVREGRGHAAGERDEGPVSDRQPPPVYMALPPRPSARARASRGKTASTRSVCCALL